MASTIGFELGSTTTVTDFTLSGTAGNLVTINSSYPTIDLLIVGGGGAGVAGSGGGGGGAGGLIYNSNYVVSPGTVFTITIGAGGAAYTSSGANTTLASSSLNLTALGGGIGATGTATADSGGSGGGAGTTYGNGFGLPGAGLQPASQWGGFGNGGGTAGTYSQGSGGGAGAAGGNFTAPGGIGKEYDISGIATYYAGGGGTVYSAGGAGGGGSGIYGGNSINAAANTGGGGAGGMNDAPAGDGGSGVVIIRYADIYAAATATTGSPTITTAGGYRVYKWTSSGSITFTADTQSTLSKSSGIVSVDYLSIQDSNATGGATWYAGANSVDAGNNTGWIFTAPPGPAPSAATGNFFLFF